MNKLSAVFDYCLISHSFEYFERDEVVKEPDKVGLYSLGWIREGRLQTMAPSSVALLLGTSFIQRLFDKQWVDFLSQCCINRFEEMTVR